MHHITLAKPDRSWLMKMSPNTRNRIMIQMKKRKNQKIDQRTWPVPKSASSIR